MSAKDMIRTWSDCIKERLLPGMSAHQLPAVAAVSLAMALARHCASGVIAGHLISERDSKVASRRRRAERLIANSRCDAEQWSAVLCRQVTANFSGLPLVIMVDETPGPGNLLCLKVTLGYHHRTLPLAWCCYRSGALPEPMPHLIERLLRQVVAAIDVTQHPTITLLADRGLAWPSLLDLCVELGLSYVLRVQGATHVCTSDGQEHRADHWTQRKGQRFAAAVKVFKKAGWRQTHLLATWPHQCKEPWLLISDRATLDAAVSRYCKRMWCEQSFRDDKSGVWQWQKSRVRDPQRAARLLLLLALASVLAVMLAAQTIKQGLRKSIDPHRRRRLSYLRLGLRRLQEILLQDQPLQLPTRLYPP